MSLQRSAYLLRNHSGIKHSGKLSMITISDLWPNFHFAKVEPLILKFRILDFSDSTKLQLLSFGKSFLICLFLRTAFCSIVIPAVAAGLTLAHASSEPLNLRKLNKQWEQRAAYLESVKVTTDIDDPKFKEPDY